MIVSWRGLGVLITAITILLHVHAQAPTSAPPATSSLRQITPTAVASSSNATGASITQGPPDSAATASLDATSTISAPASAATNTTSGDGANTTTTGTVQDISNYAVKLDATFGILGAILLVSGAAAVFAGGRSRWSSMLPVGFYFFAAVVLVLILRFGVMQQVTPPSSTVKGLFLLACLIGGIVGGLVTTIFHSQARHLLPPVAGFCLALWVLALRDGGLIQQIAFRYVLLMGTTVLFFLVGMIPKFFYLAAVTSIAWVGSMALVLGIDCFAMAGLKEFFVYLVGFDALFDNTSPFILSTAMIVELALVPSLVVVGLVFQIRFYDVLHRRFKEMQNSRQEKRERLIEAAAEKLSARMENDRHLWEERHGKVTPPTDSTRKSSMTKGDGLLPQLPLLSMMSRQNSSGSRGTSAEHELEGNLKRAFAQTPEGLDDLTLSSADLDPVHQRRKSRPSLHLSVSVPAPAYTPSSFLGQEIDFGQDERTSMPRHAGTRVVGDFGGRRHSTALARPPPSADADRRLSRASLGNVFGAKPVASPAKRGRQLSIDELNRRHSHMIRDLEGQRDGSQSLPTERTQSDQRRSRKMSVDELSKRQSYRLRDIEATAGQDDNVRLGAGAREHPEEVPRDMSRRSKRISTAALEKTVVGTTSPVIPSAQDRVSPRLAPADAEARKKPVTPWLDY